MKTLFREMIDSEIKRWLVIIILYYASVGLSYAQISEDASWEENYHYGLKLIESDRSLEAIPYLESSLKFLKENDNDNESYGEIAEKLGELHHKEKNYQEAINYYSASADHARLTLKDSLLSKRLLEIGTAAFNRGYYELGIQVVSERADLIERLEGRHNETYASNLRFLADHYKRRNQLDEALEKIISAIEIMEQLYGPDNVKTSDYKSTLCEIYRDQGEYDKALQIQDNVISLFNIEEKNSVSYAFALFTKARILEKIRDFEKAIDLYKRVRSILEDNEHPAVTVIDNNIGLVYTNSGLYEEALKYQYRAVQNTSPDNPNYEQRIENLAFLYVKLGDFSNGEKYYELAKSIWIEKNNQDKPKFGKLLNNIGKMYRQMGDLNKAKTLFKNALDLFLSNHTEDHIEYGYQLNDYANTLLDLGEHEEAINLLEKNIELSVKNDRLDKQEHFNWEFNLAEAYNRLGRYDEALPLALDASNKTKDILGEDHPIYGNMLKGLSQSYIGLKQMDKALPLIKSSNDIFINEIRKVFQFRSEKEKRDYLVVIKQQFDDLQSLYNDANVESTELNSINLNNQMLLKGLLLNNSKGILSELSSLEDPSIDDQISSYRSSKINLEKELSLPLDERETDVDSLKSRINTLEGQLVKLHSSKFSTTLELNQDWKIARNNLKEGEIVVDFSSFELIRNGKTTDSTMYAAFIYGPNSEYPVRIPICEEEELKNIIDDQEINDLYNSEKLYDLIWKPLTSQLSGNEIIYFSPSGLLNQLSLPALRKDGEYISNHFNFIQLSNSNVLFDELTEPGISSTLLIGGINYEYKEPQEETINNGDLTFLDNEALKNSSATRSRGESWTYLPGSLSEVEGLKAIYDSNNFPTKIWTGEEAKETAFKALSGTSPKILHIATHGFFFENLGRKPRYGMDLNTEDRYRLAEDPLLRSGIILAGANYTWKNGSNPFEEEDGILTAMEISNLDLSNTDMVVLSACETGLGDIDGSEGVYGLQRAFKMAGVDIIVMSLWQVPDKETAEFMNLMYGHWVEKQNVRKAFIRAQRIMQEKYKGEPEKWAAFVMFE